MPAPRVVKADSTPAPDMITRIQDNPKPLVAMAALAVLLVVAIVILSALKPKKSAALAGGARAPLAGGGSYPELPASTQMQAAMQNGNAMDQMGGDDRRFILPPQTTSRERDQVIATVDQRPDAALKVTRNWLRS